MLRPVCLFISLLLLYSCGGGSDNQDKKIFRYNEAAGITSLDPAFARSFENIAAINQVFNGLVQMDRNLGIRPCIARSWEISDSGKVYTFHLRTDVYFHDHEAFPGGKGRAVSARDFVHSFYRIINPDVSSPGKWIFNEVDFSERSSYSGFHAPDDSTLVIHLKRPFPPFLGILTMQYCSVVPAEVVAWHGDEFRKNPVGTGPFVFKAWKEGEKLVLLKNPGYWEKDENGNSLPFLDAITISFNQDRHSELLSFLDGKFDMISGLDPAYNEKLLTAQGNLREEHADKVSMQTVPFLKTDYLGFLVDPRLPLVQQSPLRKREVRLAINHCIDRKSMVKYLRNNIGMPATAGFVPRGMPGFSDTLRGYDYDPEKAAELLAKAGYPRGQGLPEIILTTPALYQDLCEFIQNQAAQAGIRLKIELVPASIHTDLTAHARLSFFRKSWVADYPDAENFLALFYSRNFTPAGPNYTHFMDQEYDRLYEQAIEEESDSARFELYRQMEQIIIREAPVVPLFYDEAVRFVRKEVDGLETNPMNLLTLKKVRKSS